MTSFVVAQAEAEDWAQVAKACADDLLRSGEAFNLGFIYVTDSLAEDLPSILTYLRQKTGIEHWTGSIGIGICAMTGDDIRGGGEYFQRPAAAVMATTMAIDDFKILPVIENEITEIAEETFQWVDAAGATIGVLHGDPSNALVPALVEEMASRMTGFFVGGLTSSMAGNYQVADQVASGGVSGLLLKPGLDIATSLSQGCIPISESHVISDCIDNILIGLDGRPALDVFLEDIGEELAEDLEQVAGLIHAALPIEGSDTGDYLVRSLVGIDPERGWLAIGEQVEIGGRVLFVRRDPISAETDMRTRLESLKTRFGKPPKAALYYSCVGRGPSLFEVEGRELSLIEDVFGNIPLVGFFGNGEISHNRLYGYTGVLTLIA